MRSPHAILVCLAAAFLPFPSILRAELSPRDRLDLRARAEAALEQRDWARAEELLTRLDESGTIEPELLDWLGRIQLERGEIEPATATAIRLDELGAGGRGRRDYELARAYAELGRTEDALSWLERALAARYEHRPRLRTDEAWSAFRDNPRFRSLAGLPPEGLDRVAGWRFDLAYLVEEARRLHADPARPAESPEFARAVAELEARIPELDDDGVVLGMQKLVALLGDGHSYLAFVGDGTPAAVDRRSLPLRFYLFSDGLYVIEAAERHRDLVGARVIDFEGVPAERLVADLAAFHGSDNEMTMRWLGVQFLVPSMLHLRALGAADEDGTTLHVVDPLGAERSVRVLPDDSFELRRKLRPQDPERAPLYLRRVDTNYWSERLPELDAVYFQMNQVQNAKSGPSIAEFAAKLRSELAESGASNLIVDLRHNNGGNNYLTFPVVRMAVWFEQAAPGRRIWVVTGRNTFSAAQNLANRLESWTDAIFVGEPSSSSPNFVGEETSVELPWSRLSGSISSRYWQDSDPGDERAWIAPDLPIALSASDYFANRDPVMEALAGILAPAGEGEPADEPGDQPER